MKSNYKNKIDHLSQSPDELMKLKNLGSYHPTRLSFSRQLINEMCKKNWSFNIFEWKINKEGKGHSILTVNTKENLYSFSLVPGNSGKPVNSSIIMHPKLHISIC